MPKRLVLLLSLTSFLCWTDSTSVDLGSLEYDNLDTDISDLKYETDSGELNNFFKPSDKTATSDQSGKDSSQFKAGVSGSQSKKSDKKGVNVKYDIEDVKKFLKQLGLHDAGSYDDAAVYALAKGIAATGVGITGNEDRKYKKGTKAKGFHKVSHKDEYNNEKEFYVDDETSGVIKKVGAKGLGFQLGAGAGLQKGTYHHDRDKGLLGKLGYSDKGNVNKEYEAFSDTKGFDAFFKINN